MSIVGGLRKRRTGFFVPIPRDTIRDKQLSFKARGLLGYLLDMPDGWDVRSEYLATQGKEGRDAVQSGLKELRRLGYYRLERRRLLDGRIIMGTAVSETPVEQWIEDNADFEDGPVLCVQMRDGTFKIKRKDGTLSDDGFEDVPADPAADSLDDEDDEEPEAVTGTGFPGTGLSDSGKPRAKRERETVDLEEHPNPSLRSGESGPPQLALVSVDAVPQPPVPTFQDFYDLYPRHEGRKDAEKAWPKAAKTEDPHVIIAALRARLPSWRGKDVKFIPLPATWLRGERWQDKIQTVPERSSSIPEGW